VADAFGGLAAVSKKFDWYASQTMFMYQRVGVDVDLRLERFAASPLAPAEAAATRALFLAANARPVEVAALLAEARKTGPELGVAFEVEGLLADRTGDTAAARAAYAKASERGGASYYAEYRYALLSWPEGDDPQRAATFARMAASLERSVAANPTFAAARDLLARTLLELDRPAEAWPHAQRAIELSPTASHHHLTTARALWALEKPQEAEYEAAKARALAIDSTDHRNAQEFLDFLTRSARHSAEQAAAATAADRQRTLAQQCQAGSADACREFGQLAEAACNGGRPQACLALGQLTERGLGRDADAARAAALYEEACADGVDGACLAYAALQWRGHGLAQDVEAATARFAGLCERGLDEACVHYATAVSSRPSPAATARARAVFEARCTAGSAKACDILDAWPK
jgi:hypothetical protein